MQQRGLRFGFVLVSLVVVAACGSSDGHGAAASPPTAPPTTRPAPTSTSTTLARAKPYDPTKPIDLGGTAGVTPAEQHRAETLLRQTIVDLRKYTYPAQATAAGYRSIGDSGTGDEHYINWSTVDDGHILDPTRPESLVYEIRDGKQQIAAAMFMLPFGSRFSDTPDVGGPLTQWHIHADLCLTDSPDQKTLAGFVPVDGKCAPGTSKAGGMPMLHVWVRPNPCGPFAALEGPGAGQVPAGQARLCDTAHGSPVSG
ncbi:MAG TPA: hypothetical protein VGP92_06145 [Acidimicrobiia bacterium]|nr:hypothetical protein [Acidimicrobiia bacterium]